VDWIARDLRGGTITEPLITAAAAADWHPRLGETERAHQIAQQTTQQDLKRE